MSWSTGVCKLILCYGFQRKHTQGNFFYFDQSYNFCGKKCKIILHISFLYNGSHLNYKTMWNCVEFLSQNHKLVEHLKWNLHLPSMGLFSCSRVPPTSAAHLSFWMLVFFYINAAIISWISNCSYGQAITFSLKF